MTTEPAPIQVEACPACGEPITWARDTSARRVPVDAHPHPSGTLALTSGWDGVPQARKPSAKLAFGRTDLHRPHVSTCTRLRVLKHKTGI